MEEKLLVSCDMCEDFQVILGVEIWLDRQMVVHNIMIFFDVIADIFILRVLMVFTWSALIS